jgi:hypothetical protein
MVLESHECFCDFGCDETGKLTGTYNEKRYDGNGIWKCPRCGALDKDHQDDMFYVRVQVKKVVEDGQEYTEAEIIEPINQKLTTTPEDCHETWKQLLEEYFGEYEVFEKYAAGTYDLEILFYDYRTCYEYEEYETVFEIAKETVVKNNPVEEQKEGKTE